MNAPYSTAPGETIEREPEPIEIDPRPCACGYTIDQHFRIDTPEGPEFYCAGDDAADIVRRWEMADPRDAWQHTGEPPPPAHVRNSDISPRPADRPQLYRTSQASRDAFWYVVGLADPEKFKTWISDHPRDARFLIKLLESK